MTIYGYARVSTADQSLDIQIAALRAAGCEKIRSEKVSGTSTNGRQELKTLLEFIEAGDVLPGEDQTGARSRNATLSLPFICARGDENMPFIFIMWAVPTIIVLGGISYYLLRVVQ